MLRAQQGSQGSQGNQGSTGPTGSGASNAGTLTIANNSTNSTFFPTFVSTTGSQSLYVSGNLSINPYSGVLTTSSGFSTTSLTLGGDNNGSIEIGGISKAPYIDFHSSSSTTDYDARLQASGGGVSAGLGTLTVTASNFTISNGTTLTYGGITAGASTTGQSGTSLVLSGSPAFSGTITGSGINFTGTAQFGTLGGSTQLAVRGTNNTDSFLVYNTAGTKYLTGKPETATDTFTLGYWTGSTWGTLVLADTVSVSSVSTNGLYLAAGTGVFNQSNSSGLNFCGGTSASSGANMVAYSQAAGSYFSWLRDNTTYMTLNGSGLGLLTSSITSKLTIQANTANTGSEASLHGMAITTGTNAQSIWTGYDGTSDAGYINAGKTGSTQPIGIQTRGGNLGVGTIQPASLLSIANGANDTSNYGKALQITNANGNRQQIAFIRYGNNVVSMGYQGSTAVWGIGTGYTTDASFTANYLSVDITNNRIGILTSAPGYGLDVNGTSAFRSSTYKANDVWHYSLDGYKRFYFSNGGTTYFGSQNGYVFRNSTDASDLVTISNAGNINFSAANPILTASSYIQISNGLYVSGGTPYFQNEAQFRGGIHNDTATYLTINGGTSNYTYINSTLGVGTTGGSSAVNITTANAYGGTNYAGIFTLTNSSGGASTPTKFVRINPTGGLEVVNNAYNAVIFTLTDAGALSVTSEITAYSSDQRLKENIKNISNALDKVSMLRGVTFDWSDKVNDLGFNPEFKHDVGVLAHDVQAVLPEAVRTAPFDRDIEDSSKSKSGENYLTVQYEKLTALLIEAVKDLNKKVGALEYKLSKLTGE